MRSSSDIVLRTPKVVDARIPQSRARCLRWPRLLNVRIVRRRQASAPMSSYATMDETMNRADTSRRTQFLADHSAKRGFNLLARHGLVKRLINERLVTALSGLGLEESNDCDIQHD